MILFIVDTVIRYHMLLMLVQLHLALCQMWVIIILFYSCLVGRYMYHVLLIHLKYNLALCQIWVIMQYLSKLYVFCHSSEINGLILSYLVQSSTIIAQAQLELDACKIYLGSVPKCSDCVHYITHFVFVLGTVISNYRGFMLIKYS